MRALRSVAPSDRRAPGCRRAGQPSHQIGAVSMRFDGQVRSGKSTKG